MKMLLLKLAFLNVFKEKIRAFLTIGGIAIGVAIMVFMIGLGEGLQAFVTSQINQTGLRDVITVESKNSRQLLLDQSAFSKIQSITGVSNVEAVINTSGLVTYNGVSLTVPIYAVTPNYFDLVPAKVTDGTLTETLAPNAHTIIFSSGALKAFSAVGSPVGKNAAVIATINKDLASNQSEDSRQLNRTSFTVKGVVERGQSPIVYVPAGFFQKQGATNFSELKVRVSYPEKMKEVRESIEQLGYQTTNIQDSIDQIDRVFKVIQSILIAFSIVTILITIFGTINTISIQLVEETQQIGFLRIMGIKSEHVKILFILQSVIIAVSGTILGIIGGLIMGLFSNELVSSVALQDIGVNQGISIFQIPVPRIILMLVLSGMLGWVIGLLPARRAMKIKPLDALKS